MAINFPSTAGQPTNGSYTYTVAGITYAWNGSSWEAAGAGASATDTTLFSVSTTAAGTAALTYNNNTGVFSYTPPNLAPLLSQEADTLSTVLGRGNGSGANDIEIADGQSIKLGASFELEGGYIKCSAPNGLKGNKINFSKVSVGATENIIMAASLAQGESEIRNIAVEPEVMDLIDCLNKMGAKIELGENRNVHIQGVDQLQGTVHSIIPDRIEAITYIIGGTIIGNDLKITNLNLEHISNVLELLNELSINYSMGENSIVVNQSEISDGIDINTMEYPGFPTDVQAQMMVLLSLGKSKSQITENIFENRFMHVPELNRMGANIEINGKTAIINPCKELSLIHI